MGSRPPVLVKRLSGQRGSRSAARIGFRTPLAQLYGKVRASIGGGLEIFGGVPHGAQDSGSLIRIQGETLRSDSDAHACAPTGGVIDFDFEIGRAHRLKY